MDDHITPMFAKLGAVSLVSLLLGKAMQSELPIISSQLVTAGWILGIFCVVGGSMWLVSGYTYVVQSTKRNAAEKGD